MNNSPLLSIIVPVYNIEKYLVQCVTSILNQNFDDFEIVLVDDGSPDRCPGICDELRKSDERIKVIHKSNEGVSFARKTGAEASKGKYIFCIDGDDWLVDGCLSSVAKVIKETSADIVCHGLTYEKSDGFFESVLPYREGLYSKSDIEREIFPLLIQKDNASYFIPSLCGKAIKRDLFLSNILADRLATFGEDGACVIPCVFNAESMYVMKDCFYYYRFNSASATKARKRVNVQWPEVVYSHITSKIDVSILDFQAQLYRKIVHDVFFVTVTQFYGVPYKKAVSDIKCILSNPLYKKAVKECRFKHSIKALVMEYTLRYRLYFLIYLYSKL